MIGRFVLLSIVLISVAGCSQPRSSDQASALRTLVKNEGSQIAAEDPLNCEQLCDANSPDWRCWPTGTLAAGRDAQLKHLVDHLQNATGPTLITQAELLRIFTLDGKGLDSLRHDTRLSGGILENDGDESVVTQKTSGGTSAHVLVPKSLQYKFDKTQWGFTLDRVSPDKGFSLKLSDPQLNYTFGGYVRSMDVRPERILVKMPHGCIDYDTRGPVTNAVTLRRYWQSASNRLSKEHEIGSSTDRISRISHSYRSAILLAGVSCLFCNPECEKKGEVSCTTGAMSGICMSRSQCTAGGGSPCE